MKPWGPFDFVKPVQSSHLITPFLFLPLWVLLLFLNMPNVLLSSFPLFYSLQCLFFLPNASFQLRVKKSAKIFGLSSALCFWSPFLRRWTPFSPLRPWAPLAVHCHIVALEGGLTGSLGLHWKGAPLPQALLAQPTGAPPPRSLAHTFSDWGFWKGKDT